MHIYIIDEQCASEGGRESRERLQDVLRIRLDYLQGA